MLFDSYQLDANELEVELAEKRRTIRWMIQMIQEANGLRDFTTEVLMCPHYAQFPLSHPIICDRLFAPFQLLRKLDKVTFTGELVPQNTAALTKLMTTNSPVINLPKLYEDLASDFRFEGALAVFKPDFKNTVVRQRLADAWNSMDQHRPADFFEARRDVVEHVEQVVRSVNEWKQRIENSRC